MTQHAFSGETTPSLVNLDANFSELYALLAKIYPRGTGVTCGGSMLNTGAPGSATGGAMVLYESGSNVYSVGVSSSGGMELAANQVGQEIRFYAGSDNTAPTLCASIGATRGLVTSPPAAAPALSVNGTMGFQLVSNTSLKILVRGSDGVTRSATLTLA